MGNYVSNIYQSVISFFSRSRGLELEVSGVVDNQLIDNDMRETIRRYRHCQQFANSLRCEMFSNRLRR